MKRSLIILCKVTNEGFNFMQHCFSTVIISVWTFFKLNAVDIKKHQLASTFKKISSGKCKCGKLYLFLITLIQLLQRKVYIHNAVIGKCYKQLYKHANLIKHVTKFNNSKQECLQWAVSDILKCDSSDDSTTMLQHFKLKTVPKN